jgi:hypothetical protein
MNAVPDVRNTDPVLSQNNGQLLVLVPYYTGTVLYTTVPIALSMKVKFYILLFSCNETFFFAMISFLRHSRTGKNCAHFEIQKLLKFWDTLLVIITAIFKRKKVFYCGSWVYKNY